MSVISFVLGFLFSTAIAWYYQRELQTRYSHLYTDFLKLVNEVSARSGGRQTFKDNKPVPTERNESTADRGEFRIVVPSMAEFEAMDQDEREDESSLDDIDMEHLRRTGVIQ